MRVRDCARTVAALAIVAGLSWGMSPASAQTVRVLATGEAYASAMKEAAKVFTEQTGTAVQIDQFPYDQAYNKMVLAGTSGSDEYDIMTPDCIWLPVLVKNKWLQPLDELDAAAATKIDWDGFVPGAVEAYDIYDGKHYAAPIDFFIEVLAYLPERLAEAGLDGPPETWEQFVQYAEVLNKPEADQYGVITMPAEQDSGYSEWTVRLVGTTMPPDSDQFVWNRAFEPVVDFNSNGLRALENWLAIKPYTPPGSSEMGYAESTAAFQQGRGAMFVNWYMIFADVEDPASSAVAGKVAYALPPVFEGTETKHDYMGGFQIAISAKAPNPVEAHAFIAFLSTDEGQRLMLENGAPGAYKAAIYNDEQWLQRYPFLRPVKEATNLIPLTSGVAEYVEMQRVVYDQLAAAWIGSKSPEAAMAEVSTNLSALFRDLGYLQ
jgi:ABC-type glycerol-3-phosphate transport system substrate-binding protein